MRFCSSCGQPVAKMIPKGDERERFVCLGCATIHYVNPKIVVGALCVHEDRILLCRRAIEPRVGFWTLPAGFMELGETAEEGAVREAMEEANAKIAIDGLLAIYSIKRIDQVQIFYHARLLDPAVSPGVESQAVMLVGFDAIPWDELAFPSVEWALRRAIELRQQARAG
ncbi:ADP-ribose pyrophosphatase YjhB, NUDIX family [Arboricoccus pini]|uniref:ADP-ribose pyrophosphatase YjhB, NUDIX family n=1 Tax=Arboricoccus pini TaxID=1963835 RepID=A0A212QYB5_9PROT|nr:NUDIX hydrolase [Arboricoccus pini]SNB64566.1 ADP-ribose pyrophosphatase YjhB, NUDIX family [Arboricoccus pini]